MPHASKSFSYGKCSIVLVNKQTKISRGWTWQLKSGVQENSAEYYYIILVKREINKYKGYVPGKMMLQLQV